MREHKLIFSRLFRDLSISINYLDVGARGDISLPWSLFDRDSLKVIGFEPDPKECNRLQEKYPHRIYYPHALWGREEERTFYQYQWESTSSMYPPNESGNRNYLERHWTGRKPKQEFKVRCVPLDAVLQTKDMPDFVKLDTQGSEYEILQGALKILTNNHPLVLAETWCAEIYHGAPLTHEVMRLLNEMGYEIFDINIAAAWSHRSQTLSDVNAKSRMVGFDLLFIKKFDQISFPDSLSLLKFAGLCELFGFRDYALMALEQSPFNGQSEIQQAIALMAANDQWERSWKRKISDKLKRILKKSTALWPQLH